MLAESEDKDQIIPRVAAVDIGKAELVCCVRVPAQRGRRKRLQEVSTHSTMIRALTELANHLVELGVQRVVLEATSDYKPVFYLLEAHGLEPWLVNARDVKHLPGRPRAPVFWAKFSPGLNSSAGKTKGTDPLAMATATWPVSSAKPPSSPAEPTRSWASAIGASQSAEAAARHRRRRALHAGHHLAPTRRRRRQIHRSRARSLHHTPQPGKAEAHPHSPARSPSATPSPSPQPRKPRAGTIIFGLADP
jgi:hypothetical protein